MEFSQVPDMEFSQVPDDFITQEYDSVAYQELLKRNCPEPLAKSSAYIIQRDKLGFMRTIGDIKVIRLCLPYLQD